MLIPATPVDGRLLCATGIEYCVIRMVAQGKRRNSPTLIGISILLPPDLVVSRSITHMSRNMKSSRHYRYWTLEEKITLLQHLEDHKGESGKWVQNQEEALDEITKQLEAVKDNGKTCLERPQVVNWVQKLPRRLEAGYPKVSLQDIYTKGPRACGVRDVQAFLGVVTTRSQRRIDRVRLLRQRDHGQISS